MKVLVLIHDATHEKRYRAAINSVQEESGEEIVAEIKHTRALSEIRLDEYGAFACETVRSAQGELAGDSERIALSGYYKGLVIYEIPRNSGDTWDSESFAKWLKSQLSRAKGAIWNSEIWRTEAFNRLILSGPFDSLAHHDVASWTGPFPNERATSRSDSADRVEALKNQLGDLATITARWRKLHFGHEELVQGVSEFLGRLEGLKVYENQGIDIVVDKCHELRDSLVSFGAGSLVREVRTLAGMESLPVRHGVDLEGPTVNRIELGLLPVRLPRGTFAPWIEWVAPLSPTNKRSVPLSINCTAAYVAGGRTGHLLVTTLWYPDLAHPTQATFENNLRRAFSSLVHWFGCAAYDSQQGWRYAKQLQQGVDLVHAGNPMESLDLAPLIGADSHSLLVIPRFASGSCQVFIMPVVDRIESRAGAAH